MSKQVLDVGNAVERAECVNEMWSNIKEILQGAASSTTGRRRKVRRNWMSDETWNVIKKREEVKLRSDLCRDDNQDVGIARTEY